MMECDMSVKASIVESLYLNYLLSFILPFFVYFVPSWLVLFHNEQFVFSWARMKNGIVDEIQKLFEEHGGSLYGGEAVTQLEHALQAAMLAETEGASPALIAAALLHDIGHLLHNLPDDAPDADIDDVHEQLAHNLLCKNFGPEVTEPVRMHVEAKRYLCRGRRVLGLAQRRVAAKPRVAGRHVHRGRGARIRTEAVLCRRRAAAAVGRSSEGFWARHARFGSFLVVCPSG